LLLVKVQTAGLDTLESSPSLQCASAVQIECWKLIPDNLRKADFRRAAIRSAVVWEPNAVANAIGYAMHYRRSHDAVIRVYDDAGNAIEMHEHKGEFKEP
jgi:hypothetical protein